MQDKKSGFLTYGAKALLVKFVCHSMLKHRPEILEPALLQISMYKHRAAFLDHSLLQLSLIFCLTPNNMNFFFLYNYLGVDVWNI